MSYTEQEIVEAWWHRRVIVYKMSVVRLTSISKSTHRTYDRIAPSVSREGKIVDHYIRPLLPTKYYLVHGIHFRDDIGN
jgi:hypothetical protein